MIRLECDYAEGAHERVLRRLFETNLEQTPGYGEDLYCARAREYIQQLCQREGIDVHFLVGGDPDQHHCDRRRAAAPSGGDRGHQRAH